MTRTQKFSLRPTCTALMVTASTLAMASPAMAGQVLFATDKAATVSLGERVSQISGLKQIRLDNGAVASFIDAADYRINADGTVDLYAGSVTIAGATEGVTIVRMPEGVEGRVVGQGSSASFTVGPDGKGKGHVLTGEASIGLAASLRRFTAGELFDVKDNGKARQVVSNGAASTPEANAAGTSGGDNGQPQVFAQRNGGPAAAALNGQPVGLGDALAAAGASADILGAARRVEAAVANPSIETFPSGDLRLLVGAAARLEGVYGGEPFNGAQADIIRAYLGFLANGGSRADFLTVYSGFLAQYLDLLRSGAAPSSFEGTTVEDINAFISFSGRTGRINTLGVRDRTLVDAYLAFILGGGDPAEFGNVFTNLTEAYFAFLRAGGNPVDFADANSETIDAYLVFLRDSGLLGRLDASDQALLAVFLDNGGFAFAGQYQAALDAYFAFLRSGGLPSEYTAVDQATLRAYLETLESTGLLARVTGDRAKFFSAYLAFLRGGGTIDGFAGLPANIYAGYATQLNTYLVFLQNGGFPSDYNAVDLATLRDYLIQLQSVGALDRFLGQNATFFTDYLAFLNSGGTPDRFAGLPVYGIYVTQLNAYFAFLQNGGFPSGYTQLTAAQIEAYLAALDAVGGFAIFPDLNAFFVEYYAFILAGNDPENFAGLPVYRIYLSAVQAYYAFILNGGLPSDYTDLDLATIQDYLNALNRSGVLQAQLDADIVAFLTAYLTFVLNGGNPDQFAGLPINQGGGGGDTPSPRLEGVNAWLFHSDAIRTNTAAIAEIDEDGRITEVTLQRPSGDITYDYSNRTADLREFGRFGDAVAWSRYYIGSANGQQNVSEHLLVGTAPVNLPTAGTVHYKLLDGTAPTDRNAAPGSEAYFTGNLGIAFGSVPRVGIDFEVYADTEAYAVGTAGGAADPLNGGLVFGTNGVFESLGLGIRGLTATSCQGFCSGQVFGGVFGDAGKYAGFTYNVFDRGTNHAIQGIAIFGTEGDEIDGLGTMPVVPDTTVTLTDRQLAFANPFVGLDYATSASATYNADGDIIAYEIDADQRTEIGSANVAEAGTNGSLTWTRWSNGTPEGVYFGTTGFDPVGPNGGYHMITGAPVTNMPNSGSVLYDLAGFTTPTRHDEAVASGSVTGQAAVMFGSEAKFGLDMNVTSGADTIKLATAGGVSDVSQSGIVIASDGTFRSRASNPAIITTQLAGSYCANGCVSFVNGFLAGDGAEDIGLAYAIRQEAAPFNFIDGTAAFSATGPLGGGGGGGGTSDGNKPVGTVGDYFMFLGAGASGAATSTSINVTDGLLLQAGSSRDSVAYTLSNDTVIESGGDQGVIGWQRFNNVAVSFVNSNGQAFQVPGVANQSWHTVYGSSAINIPTSGLINYELIGATKATTTTVSGVEGTFQGNFAVDFATLKAGLEASVEWNSVTYNFASDGGVAAPSMQIRSDGLGASRFDAVLVTTTGSGASVSRGTFLQGFLAGDGASHAGINYGIRITSSNTIQGAAAFRATGSNSAASVTTTAAMPNRMMAINPSAPIVDTPAPATKTDVWARFDKVTSEAVGLAPAGRPDARGSSNSHGRGTVSGKDVESMLGGLVSYDR